MQAQKTLVRNTSSKKESMRKTLKGLRQCCYILNILILKVNIDFFLSNFIEKTNMQGLRIFGRFAESIRYMLKMDLTAKESKEFD